LRESNVPVLLSLNFPKRTTADLPDADPETLRVLRQRNEAQKTAARLATAQVRFAFQSGGMTTITDFLVNASKAVENGLTRDEALRALTVRPAEIFGVVDRIGSIEVGKIANLTITRGDIFDKTIRISHVFIDGRPIDLKPATAGTGPSGTLASGTWTLQIKSGEGRTELATLILEQEGNRITGSIQGDSTPVQITEVSIDATGNIRFVAAVTFGEQTSQATFAGKVAGNQISGTVQTTDGKTATFNGTRNP
jgi:hypothetical protein